MDCTLIRAMLVAYHFGTSDADGRKSVEEHLPDCRDCLCAYLRLKRQFETGADASPVPSPEARARLFAHVQQTFGDPGRSPRPESPSDPRPIALRPTFLKRPVPLYQTLLAAAAVALVVRGVPGFLTLSPFAGASERDRDHASALSHQVDTSRQEPASLSVY
jgi:hypothetical protein